MFCFVSINSQTTIEKCKISKSYYDGIYSVTAEDVKCLAKNSEQPNTLFFTFARWCAPCLWHLPSLVKLTEDNDVEIYVLLLDKEDSNYAYLAKEYVKERFPELKIAIIADVEGRGRNKKYKKFLDEITPKEFENIDDMSKYIVLNNEGKVLLVTNYKDSEQDPDWKDGKPLIRRKILPLLQKKDSLTLSKIN